MTRHLPELALPIAAVALLVLVGAQAHASPINNGGVGYNGLQVPLTASYSVVGGGDSQSQDLLTYVTNGNTQVVPLTETPKVYMVDAGTEWSAQTVLNGSTSTERWVTTSNGLSGTITSPLTVSFTYYHQFLVNFNFNVTYGGIGFSPPTVTFDQLGVPTTGPATGPTWVDAGSTYAYPTQLPGTSPTERWDSSTTVTGMISGPTNVLASYYHQYLISSGYSVADGGSPPPPTFTGAAFGSAVSFQMSQGGEQTWLDSGSSTSFSPTLAGSQVPTERWVGTVMVASKAGTSLSTDNNGTVTGSLSITPVFYHQYLVNVTFAYAGGSAQGLTPPSFTYTSFGSLATADKNSSFWVDGGTTYQLPENLCCVASASVERWELGSATTGTIASATTIASTYYHQFMEAFSYYVLGQAPPSPFAQPGVTYYLSGNAQQLTLAESPQVVWADAESTYTATSTIGTPTATQRWFAPNAVGDVLGPAPNNQAAVAYDQQYLITIVGGNLPSQWAAAGNSTVLTAPGFFGRSTGTGFRVVSYQIDQGAIVPLAQPEGSFPITLAVDGPHTIAFQSVRQFQVTLDTGASTALSSITPPPIANNGYWYDAGTGVQVVLNGEWGRARGVGQRISTVSATGQTTLQVDAVGPVQAYSTSSIDAPVSITTTSVAQYEVVLNPAAQAAFVSITPPSTFPNDQFWYDAGAPPVTVTLSGIFSRSDGTGSRVTSWELDNGGVNKVATSTPIVIVTKAMTSAHFLNATVVAQYQVSLDAGATSALYSMTNPPVPSDAGWYDASSPVGAILNGVWGRSTTSGTGERLASYSVNGGQAVTVDTAGLVTALNFSSLPGPESLAATVVTQYLVTLDSGATSALSAITPPPIPQDKPWYDSGSSVGVALNGMWGRTATSDTRLSSYSVNGGASTAVLSSTPVQVFVVSGISHAETISAKTTSQYHLTSSTVPWISVTNSTLPNDSPGWFDAGTSVKAVYNDTWPVASSTSSRMSATSYTVDGTLKTNVARAGRGNFTVALTMSSAHAIAVASVTQYLLAVIGPTKVATSPASPTGDLFFDTGTKVTVTAPRMWNATTLGEKNLLTQYALDASAPAAVPSSTQPTFTPPPITMTAPHVIVFSGTSEYLVTFNFFDSTGSQPVYPSDVLLTVGNGTVDVQGAQSTWLANGTTFKVTNVSWEGASVGPPTSPSYTVEQAPLNVTLDTQVYEASIRVVDLFGLPLSGAQVSMTLANGSMVNGTTDSQGVFSVPMVPVGQYTAKVTSLGTSTLIVGSASSQQVPEGKVVLSIVTLSAIAGMVAVGVAGGVMFVRLRKRRKK